MKEQDLEAILSGLVDDQSRAVYVVNLAAAKQLPSGSPRLVWARDYFTKQKDHFGLLHLEKAAGNTRALEITADEYLKKLADKKEFISAGDLAYDVGLKEKAIQFYQKALNIAKKEDNWQLVLLLYQRLEDKEGVKKCLMERINEEKKKKHWAHVANYYAQLDDNGNVKKYFRLAIDDAIAGGNWGWAAAYYLKLGEPENAMLSFERGGFYSNALELAVQLGNAEKAKFYEMVLDPLVPKYGLLPQPPGTN